MWHQPNSLGAWPTILRQASTFLCRYVVGSTLSVIQLIEDINYKIGYNKRQALMPATPCIILYMETLYVRHFTSVFPLPFNINYHELSLICLL